MRRSHSTVAIAAAFEASLGVAAAVLAAVFDLPLARRVAVNWPSVLRGTAASIPLLLFLMFATRTHWRPLAKLRQEVERLVRELFGGVGLSGLAVVSIAAGFGEELLFRGALQPLAERWWGASVGLIVVSVIFGALHAMSRTYFVLATVVGLYLGWLAQHYDDLLAPIIVHSLYDFAALVALMRVTSGSKGS